MHKCLVVDDSLENLVELQGMLENENVQIISARGGLQAVDQLLNHEVALVLIATKMHDMDGFELAEILRSTDRTQNIPLLFVTDNVQDVHRIFQGYEKGAVDMVFRPLSKTIVQSKVKVFLDFYAQKVLLKQKHKSIRETEVYLKQALKSRDEFLSICSHELKTPLSSLKMQIQITNRLKEKNGPEVAFTTENMEKFLLQADRSVERIIHLVNDMLDISRVATGRLILNLERIDLEKLTQEVLERLHSFMELAHCPVSMKGEKGVLGNWDKFRLEQVITNLLTNVAKYAPESAVEVVVRKDGQHGVLEITDHGEGISDSDQQRIFERFERAVSPTSVSGLGLGLYISKEIIELHHGTIAVKSSVGKGSTFIVRLPLL